MYWQQVSCLNSYSMHWLPVQCFVDKKCGNIYRFPAPVCFVIPVKHNIVVWKGFRLGRVWIWQMVKFAEWNLHLFNMKKLVKREIIILVKRVWYTVTDKIKQNLQTADATTPRIRPPVEAPPACRTFDKPPEQSMYTYCPWFPHMHSTASDEGCGFTDLSCYQTWRSVSSA